MKHFLTTTLLIFTFTCVNAQKKNEKEISKWLTKHKYYYSPTNTNYIFLPIPTSEKNDTLRIAHKLNIFYAEANKVLVFASTETVKTTLINAGYKLDNQVAVNVFAIPTNNPIITANMLIDLVGKDKVIFSYFIYTDACGIFNDPEASYVYAGGYGQFWLSDVDWLAAGYTNPITHDIDSVLNWRYMHIPSTLANPNIVINIIDGGIDVTNQDFIGKVLWKWNMVSNNANVSIDDHGTNVTAIAAATVNNNYGGTGMYDGVIRNFDCKISAGALSVSAIYKSFDSLYNMCLAYPYQKQVINMSFGIGNDAVAHSKISLLYNLQNRKQCFFQKASGNAGANIHTADQGSEWIELTAWGGVTGDDPIKTLWSGSNYGDSLDFVADGENLWMPYANWSWGLGNGTSFAAPIGTGAVANLLSQDTSRSNDDIRALLRLGAKDLGTPGFDIYYGWGYARTATSLKIAVVKHVPDTINIFNNSTYNFTPKYYNKLATNRKCYLPNNTLASAVTNGDGTVSFLLNLTSANGFIQNADNEQGFVQAGK